MIEVNTLHKPIEIKINDEVFTVKKVTNRVIVEGLTIREKLLKDDTDMLTTFNLIVDFLLLYLPLDRDWIMDNLSPQDCRMVMSGLLEEMNKAMGDPEPPLASGPGGDNLPK